MSGVDPYEDFKLYLNDKLNRHLDLLWDCIVHEITWGVPCGPTLAMIPEEKVPSSFERYLRGNL